MNPSTNLDEIIIEFLSHRIYRQGKKPPADLNVRKRVSKRIWREEGVDLDLLEREGKVLDDMAESAGLLEWERTQVPVGLFRMKKERRILKDLGSLDGPIEEAAELEKDGNHPRIRALSRSALLFPLMLSSSSGQMDVVIEELAAERSDQRDPVDTDNLQARRSFMPERATASRGEDLTRLFDKKVPSEASLDFGSGMKANTLKTLIEGVLDSDPGEIRSMVESGDFLQFSRRGLKSPTLEAAFQEIGLNVDGSTETGEGFRMRLGRFLMESALGDLICEEVISSRIERLLKCSEGEAKRIADSIRSFVDGRCAPVLNDVLYRAPPENRGVVISLMAETGSRSVVEPLKRMLEFSNLERDRSAAERALKSLGVNI